MPEKTDVIINMAKDAIDKLEKSTDTCDSKAVVHGSLAMGLIDGLEQNKKIDSKEASEARVKIESLAWAFAGKCSCTKKTFK